MYDPESAGQLCQRCQPEPWAKVTLADERTMVNKTTVTIQKARFIETSSYHATSSTSVDHELKTVPIWVMEVYAMRVSGTTTHRHAMTLQLSLD